jgi:hypothetical protein
MESMKKTGVSRRDILKLPATAAVLGAASSMGFAQTAQYSPLRDTPYPDSPNLEGRAFERVTFEMSPKPFRSMAEKDVRVVCSDLFRQWAALIRRVDSVAIMLWTADGSEILDYRGSMGDEIEWARYIGIGSPPKDAPADDPTRIGLHAVSHLYMDNPPKMTYGTLAMIVRTLKQVGREMTGKPIYVGATFDPGPEFANSKFKYVRHPEIAKGDTHGRDTWVSCIARLHADNVSYAGFPKGITENMSIGTFLGGQSQHFLTDMGFDYLWLSNGFGFSISSWAVKGPLFDGTKFDVTKAPELRDSIMEFWKDFRKECPKFSLETRGTNLLLGSDLATNACPLQEIYDGSFNMIAPPNSPWAAIDGDFGLELVGYLSRIAELPANGKFPFRFYTHDPWWLNSPWFDRYGREPHDIYLPLAIARVDDKATITKPAYLEFLTVDNTYGRMPEQCANEVTPHVLSAMDSFSDAPGVLTWLCPFREYHEMVFGKTPQPETAFFADWFLRGAVNAGLPLNTVVSTGNYLSSLKASPRYFDETVLVSLLPEAGSLLESALIDRIDKGLPVLFYGPVHHASPKMLERLGLKTGEGIDGMLELKTSLDLDKDLHGGMPMQFNHRSILCGGPVDTQTSGDAAQVLATVKSGSTERVYAVKSKNVAWIRGTFSSSIGSGGARIPVPDDPTQILPAESLARAVLAQLDYSFVVTKPTASTRLPVIFAARSKNGYFLSGYAPSTVASIRMRFPMGAPLLVGRETWIEDGHATYNMPRSWHSEARCFVDQKEASEVSCVEYYAGMVGFRRRMLLKGLKNATVAFLPEDDKRVVMQVNDMRLHIEKSSTPVSKSAEGNKLTVNNITGTLFISW